MKSVPNYVLALLLAIPAVLVGVEMPSLLHIGSRELALQSDFRVLYTPGYMVRTGLRKEIYTFSAIQRVQDAQVADDHGAVPYLHPAYEALLFAPLSWLPYRAAYLVWAAINCGLVGVIFLVLRPCLPDLSATGPPWIVPALIVGFMPVAFTVLAGQDSLLLLLALALAYRRLVFNQWQAGLLFALGMFRFQVLLPVVVLFALWRCTKFIAGWAIGSAALCGLSVLITGFAAEVQYVVLLKQMSRVSFWLLLRRMPNLRGLFAACGLGMIPLIIVSLGLFLLVALVGAKQSLQRQLLVAVSVSALLTYYLFLHDASVLALPLLLGIDEAILRRNWANMALYFAALSGFTILWFARDSFYLGAVFAAGLVATQIAEMIGFPSSLSLALRSNDASAGSPAA